jgi:hypothetical protein
MRLARWHAFRAALSSHRPLKRKSSAVVGCREAAAAVLLDMMQGGNAFHNACACSNKFTSAVVKGTSISSLALPQPPSVPMPLKVIRSAALPQRTLRGECVATVCMCGLFSYYWS